MSVEIALQKHVVERLSGSPAVVALCPVANIGDEAGRPAAFPAIRFGESESYPADFDAAFHDAVAFDVVVYSDRDGTGEAKRIADAIRSTLPVGLWRVPGLRYVRAKIAGQRVTRESDGVRVVIGFDVVAQS